MRGILTVAMLGLIGTAGFEGQIAKPAVSVGAVKQVSPAKAMLDLIDQFEDEMTNVAKAMPADKYTFSPASLKIPGAKFDGVRTFADEVTHVAQANYAIASNIIGKDPDVDIPAIGRLKSKDEILTALAGSFAAVHKSVDTITAANANDFVDDAGVGPHQTRASEAAWVAVHGFDHYGQMVEYLRMNGIVPPPRVVPVAQ